MEPGEWRGARPRTTCSPTATCTPRSSACPRCSPRCTSASAPASGSAVDIAMAETMLAINEHAHWQLNGGEVGDEIPSFAPGDYPVLPTGEGHHIVISGHPAARGTFELYIKAAGRPELADDPRFATPTDRIEHLDEIIEVLGEWTSTFDDIDELEEVLAKHGLAMGVMRTVAEISHTDWARGARARSSRSTTGRAARCACPNSPWRFSAADTGVQGTARVSRRGQPRRAERAARHRPTPSSTGSRPKASCRVGRLGPDRVADAAAVGHRAHEGGVERQRAHRRRVGVRDQVGRQPKLRVRRGRRCPLPDLQQARLDGALRRARLPRRTE